MKTNKKQGRPSGAGNVRIKPEFRTKPDIEKMARALIAVAKKIAEKKMTEERASEDAAPLTNGNAEGVP